MSLSPFGGMWDSVVDAANSIPRQVYNQATELYNQTPQMPSYRNAPTKPTFQARDDRITNSLQNIYGQYAGARGWQDSDARFNAGKKQAEAQRYTQGMIDRQTALQNKANQEIENRQKTAEGMFAGLMNNMQDDPMFGYMRNSIKNWMQNPGLNKSTMRRLQGQAQARAAADLASQQNRINRSASRNGLRGAQVEDSRWAANSRSNAGLNRALLDIDLKNEDMKRQGRGQAIGAAGSMMNSYYGNLGNMAGRYSNLMTSYNPQVAQLPVYDSMQQVYSNPYYGTQAPQSNPYAALMY